jgi:hypothetical protein
MASIKKELNKILKDQCPIQNIRSILETTDRTHLNHDLMLESIEVLRMHEAEIRSLRQSLELFYQSEVLKRYLNKKKRN